MTGQPSLDGFGPAFRALCRLDDIPDRGSKGFSGPPGSFTGVFAVRHGPDVFVYVNACPHIGTSLNIRPDRFLSADGARIVCATHGASFRVHDGWCVDGPCKGEHLERVPTRVENGTVLIPADAPA